MEFQHERIDDDPPCGRLSFCLTSDLTGNGRPDVIVGGMGAKKEVNVLGKRVILRYLPVVGTALKRLESNVFWYENPGWERHEVARIPDLSVGGSLGDIDGDGTPELVIGQNGETDLYWFDIPPDPRQTWTQHLITDEFRKYHDTAIADIDDDGDPEVVILSQQSETVCYYDVPEDPAVSPWPDDHRHVIAEDLNVEGVAVIDLDGDGTTELVAGPNVFRRKGSGDDWDRERLGDDWQWTRVDVADLDGDGDIEIVVTEGDLPYHGDRRGRVGVFDPPDWSVTTLDDGLSNPHTIQIADFDGDGRPDLLVAEMGLEGGEIPRMFVYRNGDEGFDRVEIDRGVATHEAKTADLTGDGSLDIAGKSYGPDCHVDVWYRRD
ncbi:Repeat domain-containing protein [Halorubrum aquaticum]|uniref:Repeat domain-containing protein n=1 Tax=Halorubrum aquaticum TaxID=387340 RepID=A0A1I2ZMZ7_9EURY|nr:VCBS repeat-containing protein [Halorubrum aquaticum]SFH38889.1 Repeat domain-containing protein [Halorubrum aquaticum]